jgi:hypothetical protein
LGIRRLSVGLTIPLGTSTQKKGNSPPAHNLVLQFKAMQEWLNSDLVFDMPKKLYSYSIGPSYFYRHSARWSLATSLNVNYISDMKSSKDAIKVTGFAGTVWKYSDNLDLNFGVAFLGRDDLPLVAGPGFDWRPNDSWRFLLRTPIARVEYSLNNRNKFGRTLLYSDIRMIGGSYAVKRENGSRDLLTMSEFPISLGLEHSTKWGSFYGEVGYVMGREVNYERGGEDQNLDNVIKIAIGVNF